MSLVCNHEDAYLEQEEAFNSEWPPDTVVKCGADNCTGIKEWEISELFERLGA